MSNQKRTPAFEATKKHHQKNIWLDHAFIAESDFEWLENVESLTLWNVKVPEGFLATLPNLWWIDLRGGSALDLSIIEGCRTVKYLQVNQIRGITDLDQVPKLQSLQFLSLYGLPKVTALPSLKPLQSLGRIELGMLKGLSSIEGALEAPNLKELLILKTVSVLPGDVETINSHPTLEFFDWYIEDVPARMWEPVKSQINLPATKTMHHEKWFE